MNKLLKITTLFILFTVSSYAQDLNNDGQITGADQQLLRTYIRTQNILGDINGDGRVDGRDIFIISRYQIDNPTISLSSTTLNNFTINITNINPNIISQIRIEWDDTGYQSYGAGTLAETFYTSSSTHNNTYNIGENGLKYVTVFLYDKKMGWLKGLKSTIDIDDTPPTIASYTATGVQYDSVQHVIDVTPESGGLMGLFLDQDTTGTNLLGSWKPLADLDTTLFYNVGQDTTSTFWLAALDSLKNITWDSDPATIQDTPIGTFTTPIATNFIIPNQVTFSWNPSEIDSNANVDSLLFNFDFIEYTTNNPSKISIPWTTALADSDTTIAFQITYNSSPYPYDSDPTDLSDTLSITSFLVNSLDDSSEQTVDPVPFVLELETQTVEADTLYLSTPIEEDYGFTDDTLYYSIDYSAVWANMVNTDLDSTTIYVTVEPIAVPSSRPILLGGYPFSDHPNLFLYGSGDTWSDYSPTNPVREAEYDFFEYIFNIDDTIKLATILRLNGTINGKTVSAYLQGYNLATLVAPVIDYIDITPPDPGTVVQTFTPDYNDSLNIIHSTSENVEWFYYYAKGSASENYQQILAIQNPTGTLDTTISLTNLLSLVGSDTLFGIASWVDNSANENDTTAYDTSLVSSSTQYLAKFLETDTSHTVLDSAIVLIGGDTTASTMSNAMVVAFSDTVSGLDDTLAFDIPDMLVTQFTAASDTFYARLIYIFSNGSQATDTSAYWQYPYPPLPDTTPPDSVSTFTLAGDALGKDTLTVNIEGFPSDAVGGKIGLAFGTEPTDSTEYDSLYSFVIADTGDWQPREFSWDFADDGTMYGWMLLYDSEGNWTAFADRNKTSCTVDSTGEGGAPTLAEYSDDFNRADEDPPTGWTELHATDWEIISDTLVYTSGQAAIIYNQPTNTITQYVCVQCVSAARHGVVLRSTGTAADGYYCCYYYNGTWYWYEWNETGEVSEVGTATSPDPDQNDYIGITIQGIGANTILKIWDLGPTPSNFKPYDKDNWDGASDAADVTLEDDPPTGYNTGLYIGIGQYATAEAYDNWYGGDTE